MGLTTEAWKLGKAVHKLYAYAKKVDETFIRLSSDVTALGDLSNLLHEQLKDVIDAKEPGSTSPSRYDKNGTLWRCICAETD